MKNLSEQTEAELTEGLEFHAQQAGMMDPSDDGYLEHHTCWQAIIAEMRVRSLV